MAVCPECEAHIEFDEFDADVGDSVSCDECGANLVVLKMSPLELDVAGSDEDDDAEGFGEAQGIGDDDDGDEEVD